VDVLGGDAGGQHRVLAVRLVVAPPPRVPAQVHRRRVEVQVQQVVPHDFARFAGDLVGDPVHQFRVPGGPHGQAHRVGGGVDQVRWFVVVDGLLPRDAVDG